MFEWIYVQINTRSGTSLVTYDWEVRLFLFKKTNLLCLDVREPAHLVSEHSQGQLPHPPW